MRLDYSRWLFVLLLPEIAIMAQPVITVPALGSAVARAPGLPGSGIAQGSIFSVYGTGLGPADWVAANSFPLQTTLSGTSVTITMGAVKVPAIVLGANSNQVNALLPSHTPVGNGTVTVSYGGETSTPQPIQVVSSTFGIYTFNQQGTGQAIATDLNYTVNSIIHTFHPNDYVVLWGTGLGAIAGDETEPPPVANLPTKVTVYVGDTTAHVVYQGRSACCSGLDQIVFQVPAGIDGCYVPVAVETGGIEGNIGNFATIAVSEAGETCSDSIMGSDLVSQLAAGQNVSFGYIRLRSSVENAMAGPVRGLAKQDYGFATFSQYTPATAGRAQYGVSRGYCTAVDCTYGCGASMTLSGDISDASPAQLEAGTISIQGSPVVSLSQPFSSLGFYWGSLSSNGSYLSNGGTYPVAGTGGAGVGAFSVTDVAGANTGLMFTGLTNSQTVPLGSDLTLHWTSAGPLPQDGDITIYAQSGNENQRGFVQCTVPASAQSFTIPARVLSALPISGTGGAPPNSFPDGWIQIGQYNTPTSFSATGLTRGIITDIFFNGVGIYFK